MGNENRMRVCPVCGKHYTDYPATSRRDNKTLICPDCGTREAMQDSEISTDKQKEILDMIHKYSGKCETGMEEERGEEEDGK
ncbi:hypothetical protein D7X87_25720 [bacterium D16-54]|nr:hypothetical protein D7X87_25720 [bacterium D16-54]RKJ09193.1 hypothetical protein D7X65_25745 [bacterium D16-56]